jgi:outer membrane lipoprotein SlyB
MNFYRVAGLAFLTALLAACASSNSGDVYTRDQTRQVQTVKMGVVESVRQVKIEGTKTPIGAGAGAAVGGIAGSSVGDGKTSAIAAVLGAVAGGVAGAAAEEGITRKDGVEVTVRLDSGAIIAIVQEADEAFAPGETVRILEGGGVTRVTH